MRLRILISLVFYLCIGFHTSHADTSDLSASSLKAVEAGEPIAVRYEQNPWQQVDGRLVNQGEGHVVYADVILGKGDFLIESRLVLDSLERKQATFVLNGNNVFGFYGQRGKFYTKGRLLGTQLLDTAAKELIEEGVPFSCVIHRDGDKLYVDIEGTRVLDIPYTWRWGGEIGFKNIDIVDLNISGEFLSMEEYTLNPSDISRVSDAVRIVPVIIPDGDRLIDNNWHFGWPVAIKADDGSFIVIFQRTQHHHGSKRPSFPSRSTAVAIRSTDNGTTWSEPFDLQESIAQKSKNLPGSMRAIGKSSNGTIVYIGDKGAFRSEDNGLSWTHYPEAFPEVTNEDVYNHNVGPNIIVLSDSRLAAFSHLYMADGTLSDMIWAWVSADDGVSWTLEEWPLPEGYHAVEPVVINHEDDLVILGRYHDLENGFNKETGHYYYMQAVLSNASKDPATAAVTNIFSNEAIDIMTPLTSSAKANQMGGFWSQDTPDLIYNPVTERFEAVVTNRTGTGYGPHQDLTRQSLNLWSICPEDLLKGNAEWRFECTLLERNTMDVTKQIDGMHPAASIIDENNGVQHIFVYLGYYHGPAGIFCLTRPLDTARINDKKTPETTLPNKEETMKIRQFFSTLGLALAMSQSVSAELVSDGMILHLNGDSVEQIDGAPSLWSDLSGRNNSFSIASAAQGGTLVEDVLNGQPVLRFSASNKDRWQLNGALAEDFNLGEGALTCIIVCKANAYAKWQSLIRKGNFRGSSHEGYQIAAIPGGNGRFVTRLASSTGTKAGVQASAPVAEGFSVYSTVIQPRGIEGYLDGKEASSFGSSTSYTGGISAPDSVFVGVDFSGDIAEIIIFKRALSIDELNRVNAYLKEKYALKYPDITKVD